MKSIDNKQTEYKKVSCPFCSSTKIIKRGKRKTENRGLLQRYGCQGCGKRFIENDGFWKMKNNPKKVTLCLDLFYKGVSTRQIQSHLNSFYPHNSSNVSVYKWVVKYSKKISEFTDKLKLKVGSEIQVDEMEIGKRTSSHNGWFIDCIDCDTRFMVSSQFDKSRGEKEIKRILSNIKDKSNNQYKIITTDGFKVYTNSVKSVFGYYNFQRKEKTHKVVTQLRKEGFNHKIERLHNSVRHRIKTFRGFHGDVNSANAILKGYEIFYNFIKEHQAIGKCPYELATDIKLNNPNKWIELIGLANETKAL